MVPMTSKLAGSRGALSGKVQVPFVSVRIPDMSERDEKRGGGAGCAIGCLLVFLLLPVLYMLSIGPVAVLVNHNESLQWMGVIYHPLGWLAESYEPIGDALGWYVELWMG